ncbi:MAG TPA: nuclease [Blastocatellia bacterium]|nr:nuclease [Blastocatellia bacterium]
MIKSQKLFRLTFRSLRVSLFVVLTIAVALGLLRTRIIVQPVQAISANIVISQVYGGAGCGTAGCSTYKNDYIELFNRGASSVSLNGWSVQYAAATGTAWQVTNLTNVSLAPGQYYLVGEGAGANGVNNIPTADATGTVFMSATAAKIALVNTTTALSGACPSGASIIDLIGYGATANCSETAVAPAPSTTTADVRGTAGCTETDNNSTDFTATTPNPRNTATALSPCGGGGTALSINNVTQAEGNASTSNFTFTVSLSSPAPVGGVTFDIATADGTTNPANAPGDYIAKSLTGQTIAAGNSSYNFDVVVNGDTSPESNETFFVNVTNVVGATPSSVQGLGTITNDDVTLTPIHTIQGSGNTSPLVSTSVTTSGTVTGVKSNGFFLQEPDGAGVDADPNTSEGIFVFTSSAPPAAAVVSNNVQVSGTVAEFIPGTDPGTPSTTELTSPTVSILSTGNGLPAFHTITASETQVNDINNLEKFEGMRVHVDSLTVGAPTGGNVDEVNATSTSFGDFYGVITGVPRPFREVGIETPYPIPTPYPSGAAPAATIFDANPERIRVNSLGLTGSVDLQVATNAVVMGITGPLDYGFRTYTIDTDPPTVTTTPLVSGGITLTAVPVPLARELTIGSFNMQRFFDTTDDAGISDVALTTTAFNNRLNKASLAIRNVMNMPDVIGIEEMENLTTLQAVATKVNTDAGPGTTYTAYLAEGNDPGGIDVGFLVKTQANSQPRIVVNSATQYNKTETFTDPSGGTTLLNDRPPFVLRASIVQPSGATLSFSVIVNHLRSLGSVTLSTNAGAHTRVKRNLQAASLARVINEMQNGGVNGIQMLPFDQNIVSVGDYNSFQFNDGYDDVMGVVKGTPAPASQVVESSADLNNPDMTDLIDSLPADQKYSYTFGGNAQALDHTIANPNMMGRFNRFAYARMDADFPDSLRNDPNRPERISDHDPEVAYFVMAIAPTATSGIISGRIADPNGVPVAGAVVNVSGTQNRKMITDANGNYRFDNVETSGFYTVRATRANYSFSPQERSFSQLGNQTEAAFTATVLSTTSNPVDTVEYFVRQHYLDFLGREPEESGFNFWSDQILGCGSDAACAEVKRINVSAAYFQSIEFQETGGLVDGLYRTSFDRAPQYGEFTPDAASIAKDVVVGRAGWQQQLSANKQAFLDAFVQRPAFQSAYGSLSNNRYVDQLLTQSRVGWTQEERDALVNGLESGTLTRAGVLGQIAGDQRFVSAKRNQMFVMMEYFGYLRRDPDEAGYQFWLNKLNQFNGNFAQAEMVKAFIVSGEYRDRFSR